MIFLWLIQSLCHEWSPFIKIREETLNQIANSLWNSRRQWFMTTFSEAERCTLSADSHCSGLGLDVSCGVFISSQTQRKNCEVKNNCQLEVEDLASDWLVTSRSIDPLQEVEGGCRHIVRYDKNDLLQCHNDQELQWIRTITNRFGFCATTCQTSVGNNNDNLTHCSAHH